MSYDAYAAQLYIMLRHKKANNKATQLSSRAALHNHLAIIRK